ncbi:glycosyltransferase [Friedmanniella luteola]|nr:glycosyltransferase [Friedmanniella luteola]
MVDLEGPLPDLRVEGDVTQVWVVGRRAGVPQLIVEVDLSEGPEAVAEQLRPMAESVGALGLLPGGVDESALPRISVVVPSIIARTDELRTCLDGFGSLEYHDFEIILVDNRRELPADDPLPGLLAGREGVRSVRALRPGISAARNAGIAAATGEIVVFTDDDVHVDRRWLRALGERFVRQPELEAVTGLILPAELETPAQIFFERYYGGFSGERTFAPLTLTATRRPLGRSRVVVRDVTGHEVRTFAIYGVGAYGAGANMAFRRSTLQRLGGFDLALGTGTQARGGEDLATLIDVLWDGGSIGYEPAAVVHHKHRREYDELVHQLRGNGLGFTAMLTSLVLHDPRHLLALGGQLPLALRRMGSQTLARLSGRRAGAEEAAGGPDLYPKELVLRELQGMPLGPSAYVRSRRSATRWSAEHPEVAEAERSSALGAAGTRR